MERHLAWLKQAGNDLEWGEASFKAGHFSQTCFVAQQVAEKSMKAVAFYREFDLVKSHSVAKIMGQLKINGKLGSAARVLDLYYLSSRYPDALPDNTVPFEHFDSAQARQALDYAGEILARAKTEIMP